MVRNGPKRSAPECPVECGGVQSLFGQCPNVGGVNSKGSSLRPRLALNNGMQSILYSSTSILYTWNAYRQLSNGLLQSCWGLTVQYHHHSCRLSLINWVLCPTHTHPPNQPLAILFTVSCTVHPALR